MVTWCCWSIQESIIVSASVDKTIRVWNSQTSVVIDVKRSDVGPVTRCAISRDGSQVVAVGNGAQINRTMVDQKVNRKGVYTEDAPAMLVDRTGYGKILCCEFNPEGTFIATGGEDFVVRIWKGMKMETDDTSQSPEVDSPDLYLRAHKTPVTALTFSANGVGLATCAKSGNVRLWDWRKTECLFTMQAHSAGVNHLSFSSDSVRIAAIFETGNIKLWLSEKFIPTGVKEDAHEEEATCVAFCPHLHIIDPKRIRRPDGGKRPPYEIAKPSEILVTTGRDGNIKVWDATALVHSFRMEQLILQRDANIKAQAARRELHEDAKRRRERKIKVERAEVRDSFNTPNTAAISSSVYQK